MDSTALSKVFVDQVEWYAEASAPYAAAGRAAPLCYTKRTVRTGSSACPEPSLLLPLAPKTGMSGRSGL